MSARSLWADEDVLATDWEVMEEPVYEWQWRVKVDQSFKWECVSDFCTEEEISGYNAEAFERIESTKRERPARSCFEVVGEAT